MRGTTSPGIMLKKLLKAFALVVIVAVVAWAGAYAAGLRLVLDGGGMPRLQFQRSAEEQAEAVRRLANAELKVVRGKAPEGKAMHHETAFDLVLELPEGETKALRERLEKQLQQLTKARDSSKRQLGNEEFLAKAPPNVVESIRAKLADYESQIERITSTLRMLP